MPSRAKHQYHLIEQRMPRSGMCPTTLSFSCSGCACGSSREYLGVAGPRLDIRLESSDAESTRFLVLNRADAMGFEGAQKCYLKTGRRAVVSWIGAVGIRLALWTYRPLSATIPLRLELPNICNSGPSRGGERCLCELR
jgi:hypothetical protein